MSATGNEETPLDGGPLGELLDSLVSSGARDPDRLMRTALLARDVGTEMGLEREEAAVVLQVALLQDVGRLDLPAELLGAAGQLDAPTRQQLCAVPLRGEARVRDIPGLDHLAPYVRAQHERWDGSGYPDGRGGEDIPLPSRIALACDAYHAMQEPRPGREALDERVVREVLVENAGKQFCPHTVPALLAVVESSVAVVGDERPPPESGEPAEASAAEDDQPARGLTADQRRRLNELAAIASRDCGDPREAMTFVAPEPASPQRRRAPKASRLQRLAHAAWPALVGAAIGLVFALPIPDVADQCPAAREGLTMCELQKAWLPALTIVCGCAVAALLLRGLIVNGPARLRAWRRERARVRTPPGFDDDPVLVAANWGLTYEDAHPRARSWRRH